MAVYKPTLCSPFLTGVDARIGFHTDISESLIKYLTCQVDTSNKDITGYSVRILDDSNTQIFPIDSEEHDRISPINELQNAIFGYEEGETNSGINGTKLQIPFFQNVHNKTLSGHTSYNAIYYSDKYLADHIILSSSKNPLEHTLTQMEDVTHWDLTTDPEEQLKYDWEGATSEEIRKNAIVLDGDRLKNGDIILVVDSAASQKCGLWTVSSSATRVGGSSKIETVLKRFVSIAENERITVIEGEDYHNTSWKCTVAAGASTSGAMECVISGAVWKDSQDTEITGFGCRDNMYKWEVTLYQGNYDEAPTTSYGRYITYDNIKPEWLDMTLSSGKIMGTTPERVQVGGIFNNDFSTGIIPEGTDQDPLVLQGKYMELSTSTTAPSGILSGNTRVYVKTYDASFGHAYPLTDSLDATVASSANYCQFFEHSTNQEDILDTDIVNYTFMDSITITFYKVENGTWTKYTNEWEWLKNTSVLERVMVIYDELTELPNGLEDGDFILLTGQTGSSAKQNGVYTLYIDVDNNSKKKFCIKRAASYDSWSDYLGKVIYTVNGDNARGTNFESLANAGAYTLWNPQSTSTGSSPLYFVKERPILLFRNKFDASHVFTLFDTDHGCPALGSWVADIYEADGLNFQVGDIVVFNDGKYAAVTEVNVSEEQAKFGPPSSLSSSAGTLSVGDYFYITNGKTMGKLVFKWASKTTWSASDANWDLHTGCVLRNTPTRTFISPWTGLRKNMRICLLNNKQVYFKQNDSVHIFNVGSKWIKINSFNDQLYFIEHAALSAVSGRRDDTGDPPVPLQSFDISDDTVPWRYDVKFFFRVSNENPFYSYETPYIKLYKNGEEYSDLSMVGGDSNYYVLANETALVATEKFLTANSAGTGDEFIVSMYVSQAEITGRSVTLGAEYIQYSQSSWESYQWQLYDSSWNLLQDTGKKYEKDIGVTFYGLANDTVSAVTYYALLKVENDYGDTLQYTLILSIVPGTQSTFIQQGKKFTATTDCSTQSVEIVFDGLESTDESYSIYRREYEVYKKPGTVIIGFYCSPNSGYPAAKKGKFFTDSTCDVEIYPKDKHHLYKDIVTNFIYQYNEEYGTSASSLPAYEFTLTPTYKIYKGEWKPVLVRDTRTHFKDFNVQNNRSYQYIVYPGDSNILEYGLDVVKQTFANYNGRIWEISTEYSTQGIEKTGDYATSSSNGEAVVTNWNYWSITELVPEELDIDAPIIKKKYKVDNSNIWIFKYSLETGSQTQNFSKEEFQTMGQFSQFGFGDANADSGSVTAYLGSEIIPYSATQYVERLRQSRVQPLSSNERDCMLTQWQQFCFSKNPKLLKDVKGHSWIVQILSNNNTPQNFVKNIPDKISFQWKQVGSVDNVIIYGDVDSDDTEIRNSYGNIEWAPMYQNLNS